MAKKDDTNNKSTKKNILLIALRKHRISLAIVLFFVFASTTFAWFIYNKTVDLGMGAHVKSWKVFLGDDDEGDTYEIELSDLYPGMTAIDGEEIPVTNDGEMDATVSIQIKSLTLFGEEQTMGAPGATCDATIPHDDPNYVCDYTIAVSVESGKTVYTVTGYPFELKFYLGSTNLSAQHSSTLNYSLKWDYESCPANDTSCDEKDTWYGEKSYEYGNDNPSLEVVMTLNFTEVSP